MKVYKYFLIALIVIVIDQTSKLLVHHNMYLHEEINVLGEWFRLHYLLNPGMAFGTGTHATTQLCVEWLDDLLTASTVTTVLDVGCGTGILSMVASGLGVPTVIGIDNDPLSPPIAAENANPLPGLGATRPEATRHALDAVDEVG